MPISAGQAARTHTYMSAGTCVCVYVDTFYTVRSYIMSGSAMTSFEFLCAWFQCQLSCSRFAHQPLSSASASQLLARCNQ